MALYSSALALIGGTPLLRLCNIEKEAALAARLFAKLEMQNPAGSAKDRVALAMIRDAEARGLLKPGAVIIEPTSGNTGIGLAMVAGLLGYRMIVVMPDTMSPERRKLMTAYGAEVVLTDGALGMQGAIDRAHAIAAQTAGAFIPDQFGNPANALAHYQTTGPEIFTDTNGDVDILVAGVGTGGTITGAGRYLKEKNPSLRLVAVEPAGSAVLSGGSAGAHGLQGIGAGFVPSVLDTGLLDEIITVTEEQAFAAARSLCRREGVLAGISAGAALHAACVVAAREENRGKAVVTILPDTGARYLSSALF